MKFYKFILIAIIFLCIHQLKAQIALGFNSSHDLYYKGAYNFKRMYGVGFQYFVGKHVSFNNRILFGINEESKLMIHYGLGGVLTQAALSTRGGIFLTSGNVFNTLVGLVLLPIVVPEGVQFHIGNDKFQFSPYVYPASFEYNVFGDQEVKALLEVGTNFRFIVKDGLLLTPNIGWKMRYGDQKQAFTVGILVGFIAKK